MRYAILTILCFALSAGSAEARPGFVGRRTGATVSPWRPTLTASVDRTTIKLGESFTVTFSTEYATSVQRDATHWAPFFGRSDGILLPQSGCYTLTPTAAGKFTTVIRAFRRNHDLNGDGRADGARRSVTVQLTITVQP